MTTRWASLFLTAGLVAAGAAAPRDYADIRGFNYTPSTAANNIDFWRDYDRAVVERELGYAQRLQLNQARIFLHYVVYEKEPEAFLARLRHFVRAGHERGIGTMVVLWDACCTQEMPSYEYRGKAQWYPNPGPRRWGKDFWPHGEKYVRDVVRALADEPGLSFWDIMNEPYGFAKRPQMLEFLTHFAKYVRQLDSKTPITIGALNPMSDWKAVAGLVDAISIHRYESTREAMLKGLAEAKRIAAEYKKPLIRTEVGCIGRANPYDMSLEVHAREKVGWYIWELMITPGRWGTIHGVLYGDGTVRDPSIAAALMGFYRSRKPDALKASLDQEKVVTALVNDIRKWLQGGRPWDAGIALAESAAHLLEAGELAAMKRPPTATIERLRSGGPDSAALAATLTQWLPALEAEMQQGKAQ